MGLPLPSMPHKLKAFILFCGLFLQGFFVYSFNKLPAGNATFYSSRFRGVKTSSGEQYNPYLFTAAHRFFPLGSWVEVVLLKTNKSIIVRINDRGPYRQGAIIDISFSAAKEIGLVSFGVSKVSIRLVPELEISDSLRSAWSIRDSLNTRIHPFSAKKVFKKKKKRERKRTKVK